MHSKKQLIVDIFYRLESFLKSDATHDQASDLNKFVQLRDAELMEADEPAYIAVWNAKEALRGFYAAAYQGAFSEYLDDIKDDDEREEVESKRRQKAFEDVLAAFNAARKEVKRLEKELQYDDDEWKIIEVFRKNHRPDAEPQEALDACFFTTSCCDEEIVKEFGEHCINNVYGGIEHLPKETLEMYFDKESYARDLSFDFCFDYVDDGGKRTWFIFYAM